MEAHQEYVYPVLIACVPFIHPLELLLQHRPLVPSANLGGYKTELKETHLGPLVGGKTSDSSKTSPGSENGDGKQLRRPLFVVYQHY